MVLNMGRRPIFKKPMTAAQYKRRWRARGKAKAAKYAASRERRRLSRAAPPIPPEFRTGDCRKVLSDIAAEGLALITADPLWANTTLPLIPWLPQGCSTL
jgi:hypothetical protein